MKLKEELASPLRVLQEMARRIAKVAKESKLSIVEDEYVQSFKVELMDVVIQWCRGASFIDICKVRHCIYQTLSRDADMGTTEHGCSSQINSKGASFVSFVDCKSSSVKWLLLRR